MSNQWQLLNSLGLAVAGVVFFAQSPWADVVAISAIPDKPSAIQSQSNLFKKLQSPIPTGKTQPLVTTKKIAQLSQIESFYNSAVWLSQATEANESQVVKVTGVRLNPTPGGLEAILQNLDGRSLQASTFSQNNTLLADIPNAVLALPEGRFRADNPVAGITAVTATQLNANTIRVTATGENVVPTAEIVPSTSGLVFRATSVAATPEAEESIEVVVTATRTEEAVENVPRSVTVTTREEIQQQATVTPSRNLQDILAQTVPGWAPSTQSSINMRSEFAGAYKLRY